MATYFMSDVHGEYGLFSELLSKIGFGKSDKLFILGDLIDKGNRSKGLLKLASENPNVKTLMGNHEYFFLQYFSAIMKNTSDGDDYGRVLKRIDEFFPEEDVPLTWETLEYLEEMPCYFEGDEYICVHAGVELDGGGNIIPMDKQLKETMIFDRRFAGEDVFPRAGKTVLFGHTPCNYKNRTGEFIKTLRPGFSDNGEIEAYSKIQMDNGVQYTRMLGCLRLNDMKEFYVKEKYGR